jgi:glycosyltransferase involved in cell wall biosynthesis
MATQTQPLLVDRTAPQLSADRALATTNRLPRLLLVANFLSRNGGSRSVMEDLADRLGNEGERIISTSHHRAGWRRGLDMLLTALRRRRDYDLAVVDLYSRRAFLWGEAMAWLLARLRCPFILVLRGGSLPDFAAKHPQRVRACLRKAAVIVAPSPFLREEMRGYAAEPRLLPNPLDLSRYEFQLRRAPQPRLVWLRALHEVYNPTLAVAVLAALLPDFPKLRLTMIGRDKGDGSWQRVEATARALGVADHLTMAGGVAKRDVADWLNHGDVFLNTTNEDNTPVSVLEAMACGLCVVSTEVGGIPHLLAHEVDSLLVPPNDVTAMAAAVRRVLTERGLAEKLSRNGRLKTEQFDWSVVMPQWKELLTTTHPTKSLSDE